MSVSTSTRVIGYTDGEEYMCPDCLETAVVLVGLSSLAPHRPVTEAEAYKQDMDEQCAICGALIPERVPFA